MDHIAEKIARYRRMIRSGVPSVTRRSIEWLLVNALREEAGLEPEVDSDEDDRRGPELMRIAGRGLDEAMAAQGAQFGVFQIYLAALDVLVVLADRNFGPELIDQHAVERPEGRSISSRALRSGQRVIVEDVAKDALFASYLADAEAAGFRAMQSTPVMGGSGRVIGILSTQFASTRSFGGDELAAMDAQAEALSRELGRAWR